MPDALQTWHFGLVARWWAEFNQDGPEIDYYRGVIERSGEPAVDVGCGTGRLLIPYLRAGLDVDGADISGDMLAWCAEAAKRGGLSPRLYEQPMHALDIPRRYRTIFVCGSFGLAGSRAPDTLRSFYEHLEPGGSIAIDSGGPAMTEERWRRQVERVPPLPEPWPAQGTRRRAADGSELDMRTRLVAFDPAERAHSREIRVELWRDGALVASEERRLDGHEYLEGELLALMRDAGFVDVRAEDGYASEWSRGEPVRVSFGTRPA
ncbi:MAG: class I SAM-dependent methyltransferase [Chloroflexi bacterium]|nr:class I SAM-dependent methyltransferase [Chloroflexota bacterium]